MSWNKLKCNSIYKKLVSMDGKWRKEEWMKERKKGESMKKIGKYCGQMEIGWRQIEIYV